MWLLVPNLETHYILPLRELAAATKSRPLQAAARRDRTQQGRVGCGTDDALQSILSFPGMLSAQAFGTGCQRSPWQGSSFLMVQMTPVT